MIVERQLGGVTLRIECSEAHAAEAVSVLDVYERLAAAGSPIRAGTRVRFGWSLFCLVEDADALRVTEPDFASWPRLRWAPTLDSSLEVLAAQTRLLQRLAVEGQDVWFDQFMIAAVGSLARPDVFLRRVEPLADEDSGWLLGPADDPEALEREDGLERIAIASLVSTRPELLEALTLPTGFIVVFSGGRIEHVFDAEGHDLGV